MSEAFDGLRFAVIDVEGNGQRPPEIVEIAIQSVDGLSVAAEPVVWLVGPEWPIAQIVTRKVHGIRNADVAGVPTWRRSHRTWQRPLPIGSRLLTTPGSSTTCCVDRCRAGAPTVVLDTLRLARAVWPDLGTYSLDPLLDHAGILLGDEPGQRHRAGFDVHATALLFIVLARVAGGQEELFNAATLAM